ncbi:immunoglobulin-like and fibronectin type III domain-containing protein 1 isoform X3 [Carassius carassius]|uniref:immunoglobulin-like and fibronectin type III domain-containing protein 1 isoform X3 n=1 Tax=Carassius carassius TaxID=217509 RepID=UPI00286954DC|nr:immunoglobulin-like and fibronectin type III domain-containing protein 1 isoform X3 [Carassius carassius]
MMKKAKVLDPTAAGQGGIKRRSKVPGVMITQYIEELPEGMTTPDFTRKPIALTIQEGKLAIFKAKVFGNPAPTITWHRAKGEMNDPQKFQIKYDPTTSEHTLEIPKVSGDEVDTYKCYASNEYGKAVCTVVLNVIEVGFKKDKEMQKAEGTTASDPTEFRKRLRKSAGKKAEEKKEGDIDDSVWELLLSAEKKEYERICIEYGITDFRGMLKKLVEMKKEREEEQAQFIQHLRNLKHIEVKSEDAATFELEMELKDPNSRIFLYKDGVMIPYSKDVEGEMKHCLKQVGKKYIFTVKNLNPEDAGIYQVDVEGVNIFSTDFKVPLVDFALKIKEVTAQEREDAIFECVLTKPISKMVWTLKNTPLFNNEKYDITCSEDKLIHSLRIIDCMPLDAGIYAAIAGIRSCSAWLIVEADKDPATKGKKKTRKTTQAGGCGEDLLKVAAEQAERNKKEIAEALGAAKKFQAEREAAEAEAKARSAAESEAAKAAAQVATAAAAAAAKAAQDAFSAAKAKGRSEGEAKAAAEAGAQVAAAKAKVSAEEEARKQAEFKALSEGLSAEQAAAAGAAAAAAMNAQAAAVAASLGKAGATGGVGGGAAEVVGSVWAAGATGTGEAGGATGAGAAGGAPRAGGATGAGGARGSTGAGGATGAGAAGGAPGAGGAREATGTGGAAGAGGAGGAAGAGGAIGAGGARGATGAGGAGGATGAGGARGATGATGAGGTRGAAGAGGARGAAGAGGPTGAGGAGGAGGARVARGADGAGGAGGAGGADGTGGTSGADGAGGSVGAGGAGADGGAGGAGGSGGSGGEGGDGGEKKRQRAGPLVPETVLDPGVHFSAGLEDCKAIVGEAAELVCKLSSADCNGAWSKDGNEITASTEGITISKEGAVHKLKIAKVTDEFAGKYRFEADGRKTECVIDVEDPPRFSDKEIESFAKPIVIKHNQKASFKIPLIGREPFKVQWYKDGEELTPDSHCKIEISEGESRLLLIKLQRKDTGEIKIKVKNEFGTAEAISNLIVLDKPTPPLGPLEIIEASANCIEIKWRPPKDNGGCPIKHYIVERNQIGRNTWKKIGQIPGEAHYRDSDVDHGRRYCYRIRAETDEGISELMETEDVQAGTKAYPGQPSAPKVASAFKDCINLTWSPPTNTGGTSILGYNLEKRKKGSNLWGQVNPTDQPIQAKKYAVKDVVEGMEYEFRVSAINISGAGESSNPSEFVFARDPKKPPGKVIDLKVTDSTYTTLSLSWTKPKEEPGVQNEAKGYFVDVRPAENTEWDRCNTNAIIMTSYTVKGLKSMAMYWVRVIAVNEGGEGEPQELNNYILAMPPPVRPRFTDSKIKSFMVVRAGNSARFNINFEASPWPDVIWLKDAIPVSKRITISNAEGGSQILIPSADRSDTGIYTIIVKNVVGQETFSIEIRVTDEPKPPGPIVLDENVPGTVTVSWEPSPDEKRDDRLHYMVTERDSSKRSWHTVADRIFNNRFTACNIMPGREYQFRVCSKNDIGLSAPSESPKWLITCKKEKFTLNIPESKTCNLESTPRFMVPLKIHTAPQGYECYMSCAVRGNPTPHVTWYRNNVSLNTDTNYHITNTCGVCSMLILRVGAKDMGEYKVIAESSLGRAECTTNLTVRE